MPFIEEASEDYAEGAARNFFVDGDSGGWGLKPGFFRWWNSAPVRAIDVTNPDVRATADSALALLAPC